MVANHCVIFSSRWLLVAALSVFLLTGSAFAQITTGTISGTVVDPSGSIVPESQVTVTNEATGVSRNVTTGETGVFVFPGLPQGTYSVKVEKMGFRPLTRTGLILTAQERLAVGNMELTVGQTTEAVTVTAEGLPINTESADVASTLGTQQLNDLVIKGREFMNLVKLLPGVSQTAGGDVAGGTFGIGSPSIGGIRAAYNNITLDGQRGNDPGSPGFFSTGIAVDAIGEIKIVTSNYLPEIGPNPGASIRLTTKSGGRDFHGSLYWYKRHQQWNANDFFINRQGVCAGEPATSLKRCNFPYRLTTAGFTVGGPIYIPKFMNTDRSKAFFFYNTEVTRSMLPGGQTFNTVGLLQYTTPTPLERMGDFSGSRDVGNPGALIIVNDPAAGKIPFANNVIPAAQINARGQRLLSVFPQPNITDRGVSNGNYNFQFRNWQDVPKQSHTLKTDFVLSQKDTISLRLKRWVSDTKSNTGIFSYTGTPLTYYDYYFTHNDALFNWTRIFTPNIVNEFTVTYIGSREVGEPRQDRVMTPVLRSTYGLAAGQPLALGQLSPPANLANPFGLLPQLNFNTNNSFPNPVLFTMDNRAPIQAHESMFETSDNLSWNKGTHALKFGYYIHQIWTNEGQRAPNFSGNFDFSRDQNNPLDSNHPFANAMLGNFRQYSEASRRNIVRNGVTLGEWYLQDQWKATRRLTLTYGARFSLVTWYHPEAGEVASMMAEAQYNPANSPRQYQPVLIGGARRGWDPASGPATLQNTLPAYAIGAFVPGSGNPANGVVTNAQVVAGEYPQGWANKPPVQFSPRFGFAYDVFGNGKTAIRGGIGVGKDLLASAGVTTNQYGFNQPYVVNSSQFNGNIDTVFSSQGLVFPSNMGAIQRELKIPRVYNWSLGVQHTLPYRLAMDVSYVGNTNRWVTGTMDLNAFPAGFRFLQQNVDTTTAAGSPLPDNLIRQRREYVTLTRIDGIHTSYYHGLQTQLNRRYSGGNMSIAYTFAKNWGTEPGVCGTNVPACFQNQYVPNSKWLQGLQNFHQDHILVANWQYDLPRASKLVPNPIVKGLFDRWQISGIYTFASGFPMSLTASRSDLADISGSNIGARIVQLSGVDADAGTRGAPDSPEGAWFNKTAFASPQKGTFGDSGPNNFTGPPINNWDMTLMKNIPLGKSETRSLRLRLEGYNVFNHTQWLNINTAARFNAQGAQINGQLGWPTATRQQRIIQLGATLFF